MPTAPAYKQLETWQLSMDLVEQCYQATARFPTEERFGLTSQLRRAAVSIPSNVAEGYCRRNTKVYLNHVAISLGSHGELETCLELAERLAFLSAAEHALLQPNLGSVGRLLSALHQALEQKILEDEAKSRSAR
jgi:four helix bundle protein